MTDNQLLRRLRAHDQDALVQLNDRYYDYLCAVIMQILGRAGAYADAEEICNDTIHAVWNNANSIKDEKLKPYLVTAARNRAKSWLRHRGTLEMDLDEIELPDSGTTMEDTAIREELASKKSAHDAIIGSMKLASEETAQLQQLEMYRGGCARWGKTLAAVAEALPIKMQLVRLEIPEPPPQMLRDPKNPKRPPLPGPTNDTEAVTLVMTGRAARDTTIVAFMESLEGEAFTNRLGRATVRSVQQEAQTSKQGEARLLAFELECRATDRRFAK